jgi:hypothetical protein
VLIAFVDAESELGAALADRTASEVAPVRPPTLASGARNRVTRHC